MHFRNFMDMIGIYASARYDEQSYRLPTSYRGLTVVREGGSRSIMVVFGGLKR